MPENNQEYKEFGDRLKSLREEVGLSQKALAENLGMPQQTYQGYESGSRKVTLQLLNQFSEYFGVSVDFLAGKTSERKFNVNGVENSNTEESELVYLARKGEIELTEEQKKHIIKYINFIFDEEKE